MTKKTTTRKLSLNRETLRRLEVLSEAQLGEVAGGRYTIQCDPKVGKMSQRC